MTKKKKKMEILPELEVLEKIKAHSESQEKKMRRLGNTGEIKQN